jgi:hypothetical protein
MSATLRDTSRCRPGSILTFHESDKPVAIDKGAKRHAMIRKDGKQARMESNLKHLE